MPAGLLAQPFFGDDFERRNPGRINVLAAGSTHRGLGEVLFRSLLSWKFESLSRPRGSLRPVIEPRKAIAIATGAASLMIPLY
jgi:hypothetical protein